MSYNLTTGDHVVAKIFTNSAHTAYEEVLAKVLRIYPGDNGVLVRVIGLDDSHRMWGMTLPLSWEQVSQ
jgi:hypothetical protein